MNSDRIQYIQRNPKACRTNHRCIHGEYCTLVAGFKLHIEINSKWILLSNLMSLLDLGCLRFSCSFTSIILVLYSYQPGLNPPGIFRCVMAGHLCHEVLQKESIQVGWVAPYCIGNLELFWLQEMARPQKWIPQRSIYVHKLFISWHKYVV